MARRLTAKETERARNRANAQKSTGPRTAAGKARASRNAITHGLAGPVDGAEVANRDRRAAALALEIAPGGAVEAALVERLAAAFQRLEKADHLEAQLFDGCIPLGRRAAGDAALPSDRPPPEAGRAGPLPRHRRGRDDPDAAHPGGPTRGPPPRR